MTIRKSKTSVTYDDRTPDEKLVDLFTKLVQVIQSRGGDIDTEDGTFATVDLDEFLRLEQEFEDTFDRTIEEVVNMSQVRWLVKNKITK
ncbi:hypothetical protein VPHF99_0178 [Vibrio phage F99]|nr:hypothetical protein MYOV085v1_p0230 [Vibrio phage 355E48.1]